MKQVDFDVRVLTLNPGGINGAFTHDSAVAWVKENYPYAQGWKVETVQHIQMSADGVSILFFLTKWVDDMVSAKAK